MTGALTAGAVQTGCRTLYGKTLYVYADPILRDDKAAGALAVFLDASDLKVAELLKSSPNSMLVEGPDVIKSGDEATKKPNSTMANFNPSSRDDWQMGITITYKDYAALDGLGAKTGPITLKHYGSEIARTLAGDARAKLRVLMSSNLINVNTYARP